MTTFIKVPGRTGTAILIESLGGERFIVESVSSQ
jgi:hypothetical protein